MRYHAVAFKDTHASFECATMGLAVGRLPVSITLPKHCSVLIYSLVL